MDDCQFGYLTVELDSFFIPLMSHNYTKQADSNQGGELNQVFMIRLKVGAETNAVFLGAPDRILDPLH